MTRAPFLFMSRNSKTTNLNKKRILIAFLMICFLFAGLAMRMGYHQVIMAESYSQKAVKQQTSDKVVTAVRGSIVDRNGSQLAISATTNTVWVRPDDVKNNGKNADEQAYNIYAEATSLSAILGMEYNSVFTTITSDKKLTKLAKNVDYETADALRAARLTGIEIVEDAKRYYPLKSFASQLLGTTTDDNVGLTGIELFYNRYLSGTNGRWIMSKDIRSNSLSFGTNKYYSAEDGCTVQLTIDENIQYVVEQKIAEGREKYESNRVVCLVMDPKTAEILAMAQTNEFDPNNPREPMPEDAEAFALMSSSQQVDYWNRMWRCFCVSDTYEPGSTFKLITTSIALDLGVTYKDETFYCPGYMDVADWTLHCWNYPSAHGTQTLAQAIQNSCNVTMITLSQRMGLTNYFAGIDSFGFTQKTGIDYPGESSNIIQDIYSSGPVELATMSYGQGIAVTPVSMLTAVCSIANGGYLMQPHFMKALLDPEGNVIEETEPEVKSITVSAQTASEMLGIMESVVNEGGGGSAKIPGYHIGGKTGTANKPEAGSYSKTDVIASFLGVAPIEDPKFAILVLVDTPRNGKYGSSTAAPIAKEIMQEILMYMDIQPNYTKAELAAIQSKQTTVPNVTGLAMEDAIGKLAGRNLKYVIAPEVDSYSDLSVVDQYPKGGETVNKNTTITLYYK